ncbi:uncharacterized protein LOC122651659 isoform X1 [Telopea speciosissima]|uniref:uncharacterized protein LOC122651659 isoform X1 n=1 Tax=Telopea speciosissima TaxID=54955 RepID=UPI001CC4936D|nr:uncharacterized protein LOC122651659 isoform X1 [Telopea speciosissima]
MFDCVPSAPLTCSGVVTLKLGLLRCNWKVRFCRTEFFRRIDYCRSSKLSNDFSSVRLGTRNGVQFAGASFNRNGGEIDDVSPFDLVRLSRNSDALGSRNHDIYDELGLKEEDGKEEDVRFNPTAASGFSGGRTEDDNSSTASVSSNVDFLELKSDLENGERTTRSSGSLETEDVIRTEGTGSTYDKLGPSIGSSGLRSGRQMIRRSSMLAKQVISVQSALSLGFISQLWVDTCSWLVIMVEVRPSLLSGETERFVLKDICQVGDVVLVKDESVLENEFKMIGLDTLVGYNVITPNKRNIGKVRGYTFNVNSGAVESLELDSLGISIIPSSLVSTFALFVEDVLEVVSDTVVVHETAASRIQRLTKGLLDNRNVDASQDEFGEYGSFDSRSARVDHNQSSQKNYSSRQFGSKMKEIEEDWHLPMDYL